MKIIAATGANGYIGTALVKVGVVPIASDVTNPDKLRHELNEIKPDIILHLASKSDPDWCQREENKQVVTSVNLRGTHNVMYAASLSEIPCVLMSTGQVWKGGFWESDPRREDDKPTPPVNQYGLSKLAAESIAKTFVEGRIIRSSYVFDTTRLSAKLDSLKKGEKLYEPTFIRRSFIYLPDIVELLLEYCGRIQEMPTVLHLAGCETISWYEFMVDLACEYGLDASLVKPRRNELYNGLAPRPHNAGLDTSLASRLGFRVPSYFDGIKRMKNES